MANDNSVQVSGYAPDLKNRELLSVYLRHRDSYSAIDLLPEVLLVSARLSQLLVNLHFEDELGDWKQILALIELKRRLVDSLTKYEDLKFRQKEIKRINDHNLTKSKLLAPEDYKEALAAITRVTFEFIPESKRTEFAAKLEELKALYVVG